MFERSTLEKQNDKGRVEEEQRKRSKAETLSEPVSGYINATQLVVCEQEKYMKQFEDMEQSIEGMFKLYVKGRTRRRTTRTNR